MVKLHPHAEAKYRVVPRADTTFGVEVTIRDTQPATITSLAREADAEAWIADHKRRVLQGPMDRRWIKRGSQAAKVALATPVKRPSL